MQSPSSAARPAPAIFIVHSLDQATAAATAAADAGRPAVLRSARGAAGYAGSGWFLEIVGQARRAVPHAEIAGVIDCGDDMAAAIEAIALLHTEDARRLTVRFDGPPAARAKIANIARSYSIALDGTDAPACDLSAHANPAAHARNFLA
tara:strand:+ start:346 stop:792 length:447 start_codon:yes stop_codon:yes gene_type:complete